MLWSTNNITHSFIIRGMQLCKQSNAMPRVNHSTQHHPSLNICISQRTVPERSLITRCLPSFKLMVRRYWTFCSAEALWLSFNPAGNWQAESKRLGCWMIVIIIMTILEWSTWRNTTLCLLCSSRQHFLLLKYSHLVPVLQVGQSHCFHWECPEKEINVCHP